MHSTQDRWARSHQYTSRTDRSIKKIIVEGLLMFPKSKTDEKKHRKHKRQIEITMAIDAIFNIRENFSSTYFKTKETNILEFGCGDGFQIPYLKQKGNVIALDVKKSNDIENIQDVEFVECSIANTPFGDGYFDIIYSNHVVEHIDDTTGTFDELIRIGKSKCIYAVGWRSLK